jgi:hypothetical protein
VAEREACLNSGMSEFLSKPPDMKEFVRILKEVFGDTFDLASE